MFPSCRSDVMSRMLSLLALLGLAGLAGAQETAVERSRALAPFLDGQTIVVARFNLTAVDPDALVGQFAALTQLPPDQLAEPRKGLEALAAVGRAGGRDLYLVVSLADM